MLKAFKDMLRAGKIADFNTTQSDLRESGEEKDQSTTRMSAIKQTD
jgi:hypothetical protein